MYKKTVAQKKMNVIIKSADLFYIKGYKNTSLNDILEVCKIPKGSFYYYFKSKDDLLLHVIDYHKNNILKFFDSSVDDLSIYKLKAFFSQYLNQISLNDYKGGSALGNLNSELSDINDIVRDKLNDAYFKIEMRIVFFLKVMGCGNKKYINDNVVFYAKTLMTQLEGCCLKIKRVKNQEPINEFLDFFDLVIKMIINEK